jgi:glycosidase
MLEDMRETKYYGDVGLLYPYDIRYDAQDRAFCNPLPGGRVQFRIHTEHGFEEATLVYNDGTVQGAPMELYADDSTRLYWETTIEPARPLVIYSFALKTADGQIVYYCRHGVDHAVEPLDRWRLELDTIEPFETPAWMHGAVVYHIFPERFANGDATNDPPGTVPWGSRPDWLEFQGGDLQGVIHHLDFLVGLGVEALYLNPINTSPSTHKFDALDYYHVDPAFGGDAALHELVDALHQRGMRIIVDASFNHCHPRFFAFQDVMQNGPNSRYWDWFTIHEFPIRVRYRPHLLTEEQSRHYAQYVDWLRDFPQATGIPLEEATGEGPLIEPTYLAWYGVLDMPKLNQRNPETRAYFLDVAAYWLREFGIDGWRMDVARHIEADFWVDFRRVTKGVRPDCYLLAEIWGEAAPWLQGDQFDATMNYILRDLCVEYLAQAAMDTRTFLDGVTRMVSRYAPQVAAVTYNLISSHDVARFLHVAGGERRRLRLAILFQLTIPGAPGIYYGDEIGMSGGDDPANRRAFPWHRPESWDRDTLSLTRELVRLRKTHPALRLGTWRCIWWADEAFAFERLHVDQRLVVVIARQRPVRRAVLPVTTPAPQVVWGTAEVSVSGQGLIVEGVDAWSGAIIDCPEDRG